MQINSTSGSDDVSQGGSVAGGKVALAFISLFTTIVCTFNEAHAIITIFSASNLCSWQQWQCRGEERH